jgi:hypothetical protein
MTVFLTRRVKRIIDCHLPFNGVLRDPGIQYNLVYRPVCGADQVTPLYIAHSTYGLYAAVYSCRIDHSALFYVLVYLNFEML